MCIRDSDGVFAHLGLIHQFIRAPDGGFQRFPVILRDAADAHGQMQMREARNDGVVHGAAHPFQHGFQIIVPYAVQNQQKLVAAETDEYVVVAVSYTHLDVYKRQVYDSAFCDVEIKSWADLWNPELADSIAVPEMTTTSGPLFYYATAAAFGLEPGKDDEAIFALSLIHI